MVGYLFVCGVPRSGTTALARQLNLHPDICIGIERFQNIGIGKRGREFLPALFEEGRFFDFRLGDAPEAEAKAFSAEYVQMRAKWPTRVWVGDKIPRLTTAPNICLRPFRIRRSCSSVAI